MNTVVDEIKNEQIKTERKKAEILLDFFHSVNMDELNSISENNISKYKNSSFTFKEIKREFDYIYKLLNEGKNLMAIVLLRNTFEDLMYFFATNINSNLKVNTDTKASQLRNVVKDNADKYFDDMFCSTDFKDIYEHLSKAVHVTSIKECINYLDSRSKYREFISTEFKFEVVVIECMLLQFLSKRGKYRNDFQRDTLVVASTVSMLNTVCFAIVFKHKHNKKINGFFYDATSRNYLQSKSQNLASDLQYLKTEKDRINQIIENSIKELGKKYIALGYEEKMARMLNHAFI